MVLPACDPREPSVHIPPLAGSSATFIKPPGSSQTPVLPSSMAHCILNTCPHYNVHDPTLQQMHSLDHFPGSACSGDCHGQYHLPRQNRGAPGHSVLYKARPAHWLVETTRKMPSFAIINSNLPFEKNSLSSAKEVLWIMHAGFAFQCNWFSSAVHLKMFSVLARSTTSCNTHAMLNYIKRTKKQTRKVN